MIIIIIILNKQAEGKGFDWVGKSSKYRNKWT